VAERVEALGVEALRFFSVPLYAAPLWRDVGIALLRPFV
jgi:hypothetical protein